MRDDYYPGKGCQCAAYREVELESEVAKLKKQVDAYRAALEDIVDSDNPYDLAWKALQSGEERTTK